MIKFVKNLGQREHADPVADKEEREKQGAGPDDMLVLNYDQRVKGRLRATTQSGRDVGLFLERGKVLRDGDVLESDQGEHLSVKAAEETLTEAWCSDSHLFARCCYHLGNRHVPIEIFDNRLCFRPDAILEDMLVQLGMDVGKTLAPFNPESGAYSNSADPHRSHSHSHSHSHHEH